MNPEMIDQLIFATHENPIGNLIDETTNLVTGRGSARFYGWQEATRDISLTLTGAIKGSIFLLTAWKTLSDGTECVKSFLENNPQRFHQFAPELGLAMGVGLALLPTIHLIQEYYILHRHHF